MRIDIQNRQRIVRIDRRKIQRLAQKVLSHFKLGQEIHVNFLFVDDKKMSVLHEGFLGKEGSTDVLAFSMREGKPLKGDSALLGDIAISTETAIRQARRFHSSVERELALYVIHGMLHLLGYEDHHRRSRLKMRRKERELLKQWPKNGTSPTV
ncbi:MAG: rRNA maturation RNase YbeY [Candidatus Omnitrophica bacterium]|nr:rRNA maturation RNase YbeY [Candidatus Omnitrophota bacterium]